MDGAPFRPLGNELGLSPSQTYARVIEELKQLPNNTELTQTYCDRWSGILNIDGKYITVKGFQKRIPFIWCVDFLQHDFPTSVFAQTESVAAFSKLFEGLLSCHYPLRVAVCDDVAPLKIALKRYYPAAEIQLCHTHYIENIRQQIHLRTETTYHHFFNSLMYHVFSDPLTRSEREHGLWHVWQYRTNGDRLLCSIVQAIARRFNDLFRYTTINRCPKTNNIIECFNSHLKQRLNSVKGFQSFESAERFLNAFLIRRRTKPFTDCEGQFKHFNKHMPLENSIRLNQPWPNILGCQDPKTER